MELNKNNIKKIMLLIAFGILLCFGLANLHRVPSLLSWIGYVLEPITFGIVVAYIFNALVHEIEIHTFSWINHRCTKRWPKIRHPISVIATMLIIAGIFILVAWVVIPDLISAITKLSSVIPSFVDQLQRNYNQLNTKYPAISKQLKNVHIDWTSLSQMLSKYTHQIATNLVSYMITWTTNLFRGFLTFILGLVIAINILLQKKTLKKQMRKLLLAYLPNKFTNKTFKVCHLANEAFAGFITGQCLGAVLLGVMCFVGMTLLRFPFALLISVFVAILSFLPFIGQFFSALIGALIILTVNPVQAFWYIVYVIALQQLNGNLVYPKVVGSKMGLPVLWVLVAITIGGNAFGIVGMLVSIPIFAVIQVLLRENINERLSKEKAL